MTEEKTPIIIISGNKTLNDYLGIIFKLGKYHDKIILRFMDNYSGLVDSLIVGLRKSFGWLLEDDIKKIEDDNKKCIYFNDGNLSNPGEPVRKGKDYGKCTNPKSSYPNCTFQVRNICKHYKQKNKTRFLINEAVILKHGALKGL